MEGMFYGCKSLRSLDLTNFVTQQVTNMHLMFYNCKSLNSLDLSNFNIKNVINMDYMFYNCNELKYIDISSFIIEENIYLFSNLPNYCQIVINTESNGNINSIPDSCEIVFQDN